jgi:CHAP domain
MSTMWYQQPYPQKPMLPVPGFPRPLYPPDAVNYAPSEDGPDVLAYKRTISRLCRWPWQTFDAAFSNAFSHGKSGNVGETGVAGFQRQMGIDPTGYIGPATFDKLRSSIIPAGLPNAGQYGMDVTALNLIGEAYQIFKGNPTPPPPAKPLRQKALAMAITQIGVKENPANSNRCKFTDWYGLVGPWCAMFATWAYEMSGDSPSFIRGSRYAYVPYIVSDGQNARYGLSITTNPIPGDLVCYDWDGGAYDHVGIFESGNASAWTAIEGNTSTSNNSNGGEVMRRNRNRNMVNRVSFVRVREP